MGFLSGYKTYIAAAVAIIVGLLEGIGIDVPGVEVADNWLSLVLAGFMAGSMRAGIAKAEKAAKEK